MNLTLYTGRPEDCTGRLEKEVRTYDLLDKLGMEYWRTDLRKARRGMTRPNTRNT